MSGVIPTEHAEQCTLVSWFNRSYPHLKIFAIPNGAHLAGTIKQRAKQVQRLKREGMVAGVPDLMIPAAFSGYHGLFIEMKRAKGSSTSEEQKDWLKFLTDQGYKAVVCKGWEEAKEVIIGYTAQA